MLVTIALWLCFTLTLAWWYVTSRVSLSSAFGYEREWDWQLFFFAITRLPGLILFLAVVLWLEWKWLSRAAKP